MVKHLSFSTSHRYVTKPWVFSGTVLSASFSCCKNMGNAWLLNYFIHNFHVSCILFFFFFYRTAINSICKEAISSCCKCLVHYSFYWLIITVKLKSEKNSGLKAIDSNPWPLRALHRYCSCFSAVQIYDSSYIHLHYSFSKFTCIYMSVTFSCLYS